MERVQTRALVIGGGPAGLMAAEELARAGQTVILTDAMPTVGRKFLMAGKSGLNLTKDQPMEDHLAGYATGIGGDSVGLQAALADFGPDAVMDWARDLGQPVFSGTSGRVFPVTMKASPLLRAWLARLQAAGVTIRTRHRWMGWDGDAALFATPTGKIAIDAGTTVFALGGASWTRLGSDGAWAAHLGNSVVPFRPANMGFTVNWSSHMARHFGQPVKGTALIAGALRERGEWVISARGIEGGGVYAVSSSVRDGAALFIDLMPDVASENVRARLNRPRGKATLAAHLRKALGLDPVRLALLQEFGRPLPADPAALIKALPLLHSGPRPMDEAISTAGGLRLDALDSELMLRKRPGVFAAGEMLDWEAPTGGYLITGCLATGRHAGRAAARWLSRVPAN
jgi:uncharacterized flavoprotein (TIGR03862 family)